MPKFQRHTYVSVPKPSLAMPRGEKSLTEEVVMLLYPQDFVLLIALFEENVFRGVRNRRPRKGEHD